MIYYSANWMGPINMQWYEDRGLTRKYSITLEEDDFLVCKGFHKAGDVVERDEVTIHYSAGRIDIRGLPEEEYWSGWHEYSLPPMRGEDWYDFSDWLKSFQTHELWEFDDIIALYESASGRKIRWAEDIWWKCWECGLVTDLREHAEHIHKMDCSKN
jgi:hypothetical protein